MKTKILIFLSLIFSVGIILYLSIFKVPENHIGLSGKKIYEKGIHFKPFFKRVYLFPDPFNLIQKKELLTREGSNLNTKIEISFNWDRENLWKEPKSIKKLKNFIQELKNYQNSRTEIENFLKNLPAKNIKISLSIEGELPFEIKEKFKPTGKKVFLFALDGLDWNLLEFLFEKGKLPNFKKIKDEGAWANLLSYKPLLSPIIWTSIATSRTPEEHGILEFTMKDPYTQKDVPVTSNLREVPAFWNILSSFNLKTNLIGWWATFPAEKIKGNIVTERLFFHLFGIETEKKVKGNTYPYDLEEKFENLLIKAEDITYTEISQYLNISKDEFNRAWEEGKRMENPFDNKINHLRKILSVTHSAKNIAFKLLEDEDFDFFAFYLEGTDTIGHRFAHLLPPKLPWVSEKEFEEGKGAMIRYYELMDEILGEILKKSDKNWTISIASDHGFYTIGARPSAKPDDFGGGASQWHRMTGVWMIKGENIKRGEFSNCDIYDIIPTLFSIIGVPLSREMKGKVIKEIFIKVPEINFVESYDFIPKDLKGEKVFVEDKERLKELQALGYIAPSPKKEEKKDFTFYYNLGTTHFENGEFDKAEEAYKKAIEIYPEFSLANAGLSNVYEKKGDFQKAYIYAKKAYPYEKELGEGFLLKFVEYAINSRNEEDALKILKENPFGWEKRAVYWSGMGILKEKKGEDPKYFYIEALKRNPADPTSCEKLLNYYLKNKDFERAAYLLKNAWDSSQGNLNLMNSLGVVCLKNGQGKIAEDIFKTLLESNPGEAKLLGNLSLALRMQGKIKDAQKSLLEAIKMNPKDFQLYFNYAIVLEEIGELQGALEYLNKAKENKMPGAQLYNAYGRIYLKLGKKEEAKTSFEKSLSINPNQEEIKEILKKMQ